MGLKAVANALASTGITDSSGAPGNVVNNATRGRAAIAAAATACVVTNNQVTANSMVIAVLRSADATLTFIKTVVTAAGSFTVTGNAAATGACPFDFLVVN